mgnify:CR=1 FL=1
MHILIVEKEVFNIGIKNRVDNSKGYVLNNCVPCCGNCNYIKRDKNHEEFLELISKIYENIINKYPERYTQPSTKAV